MLVTQHGRNCQQNNFLLLIRIVSQAITSFMQLMQKHAISMSLINGAIGVCVGMLKIISR